MREKEKGKGEYPDLAITVFILDRLEPVSIITL